MDEEPLLFSAAGREFAAVYTHNARASTLGGQLRDTFLGAHVAGGNAAHRRGGDVRLGGAKLSGAKPDTGEEPVSAGVLGEPVTGRGRALLLLGALVIAFAAAAYTGLIFHQKHRIDALVRQSSLQQLALTDPATGFTCAHCDAASGDLVFEAGTVFLGAAGAGLMPDTYTDECMTCGSDGANEFGADVHRAVPLLQDDYVPLDAAGQTVYAYGHTFQATAGAAADGGLPRAPYFLETSELTLRSGILGLSRFAMGQTCTGATCSTTYDASYTDAPSAGPTAGFPDVCSGTTDATVPANSLYTVHRDMDVATEFVGGAVTLGNTIGTTAGSLTFVHLCACIASPANMGARTQYCTSPFIGAYGGDDTIAGTPVVAA